MKICKDCKWCNVPTSPLVQQIDTEYICTHPRSTECQEPNIITGKVIYYTCIYMRSVRGAMGNIKLCGPDGDLFEAK